MVSLSSHGLLVSSLGAERVVVEVNVSNLQEGNEGFMLFDSLQTFCPRANMFTLKGEGSDRFKSFKLPLSKS